MPVGLFDARIGVRIVQSSQESLRNVFIHAIGASAQSACDGGPSSKTWIQFSARVIIEVQHAASASARSSFRLARSVNGSR